MTSAQIPCAISASARAAASTPVAVMIFWMLTGCPLSNGRSAGRASAGKGDLFATSQDDGFPVPSFQLWSEVGHAGHSVWRAEDAEGRQQTLAYAVHNAVSEDACPVPATPVGCLSPLQVTALQPIERNSPSRC